MWKYWQRLARMSEVKREKKKYRWRKDEILSFGGEYIAFHFPIAISIFSLAMGMPRRESSWQSLLARYTSSVSLTSCHRTSSWTLNGAERLIDCRKIETSSTSLNIHITRFFYSHSPCRNFILRRAPGCFTDLLDFFLFVSSFCCSSHSLILHTVSSFALLSASNEENRWNVLAIVMGIDFTSLTLESNFRRSHCLTLSNC